MQDIDFDEIDRAVSSVSNTNTGGAVSATPVIAPTPVVSEPASMPVETVAPMPVVPSPAARRSTGRFMDVVHSSSDMRPTRISAPSAPSLHREEVAERPSVAARQEPTAIASSAFHWPDPIEAAQPAAVPAVEPVSAPSSDAELLNSEDFAAPLESPFLTNAKVEKRPLGAFSDADSDMSLIEDPIPFSGNETSQFDTSSEVSPEVEALLAETETIEAQPEQEEAPLLLEAHTEEVSAPAWTAPVAPEPTVLAVEDVPVGPTSITQQYTEQPADTNQASGSIYDTESYHQALVHTPKKHSSVLIIVWIIALILVGGGIGAGVYFVVLPLLG